MVKAKKASKLKASSSKYAKKSGPKEIDELEEDYAEDVEDDFVEDEQSEDGKDYVDENADDYSDEPLNEQDDPITTHQGHVRSRGLFENIWWKKGLLKGLVVWFAIVIIFYLFDFLGLIEVIDWKRWIFFLVLLIIAGMTYEKFMAGRIQI